MNESANLDGIVDTRMVFIDYDPWAQRFSVPRSGSNGEADAEADEDFSASEASDHDSGDDTFGSPVNGAEIDIEMMEIADLTYKKDTIIHKKDRHLAIFMMLKGKGHDDDRQYKRIGLVKVSYDTDEKFIKAFREATLKRQNKNCVIV